MPTLDPTQNSYGDPMKSGLSAFEPKIDDIYIYLTFYIDMSRNVQHKTYSYYLYYLFLN